MGAIQWPIAGSGARIAGTYRNLLLNDRERAQTKASLAMQLAPGFVITPTVGLKNDHYAINEYAPEQGL